MATTNEYNQFRRLVGDFEVDAIDDDVIDSFLDDATQELTADFATPVETFDVLVRQYHPEVIYWAALQWWWQYLSVQTTKHTTTIGQASENKGERWDRAMRMIEMLSARFEAIQTLGTDITIGNLSRFSKATLTRLGGQREEDVVDDFPT